MAGWLKRHWLDLILSVSPSGVIGFLFTVYTQNKELLLMLIIPFLLVGVMFLVVIFRLDKIERIVTKDTDKLTKEEIKSCENINLRYENFLEQAKPILAKVEELKSSLDNLEERAGKAINQLNDRAYADFSTHRNRLEELFGAIIALKALIQGYNPSVNNIKDMGISVKHSQTEVQSQQRYENYKVF